MRALIRQASDARRVRELAACDASDSMRNAVPHNKCKLEINLKLVAFGCRSELSACFAALTWMFACACVCRLSFVVIGGTRLMSVVGRLSVLSCHKLLFNVAM